MPTCKVCSQEMQQILFDDIPDAFFNICHPCHLTHQKMPVKDIIEHYSNPDINRYLKLMVLNFVNELPIHSLFEFYVANQHAFTVEDFDRTVQTFHKRREP